MKPPHSRGPGGSSRPPTSSTSSGKPPHRGPARGPGGAPSRHSGTAAAKAGASAGAGARSYAPRPSGGAPRPEGSANRHGGAKPAPRGEFRRPAKPPSEPDSLGQPPPLQLAPSPVQPTPSTYRRPQEPSGPRPGSPDSPRGTVWLYGHHAVAAALANPQRRLRRLLLTEEAEASLSKRLPPPWSVTAEKVDRPRLDHLLGRDVVHQGAALLADPLASPGLAQTLERPGPILVLDQISDPRNVGAILRSAAAFGVAAVIAQDRNAPDETGALAKAASGALERVPLLRAVNIARTLIALKAAGCWVVGLDGEARETLSGRALAERRVVLVLGAEGDGLRRLTRETCDELAGLAMPGGMESLNVSAAAAIALYEVTRKE